MAQAMSPSMTYGQINKAVDVFRAFLRKHSSEFGLEATQQVLGNPALGPNLLAVFRQMVESVSGMITRHVNVNRNRTHLQMINALNRRQYIDRDVVEAMPRGQGGEADVHFYPVSRSISDDDLEKKYQSEGWVAADPYLVAAANEEDPAFADEHPNFAHWKDAQGKWCYLACDRYDGERGVSLRRPVHSWFVAWSVAVVRKSLDA